MPTPSLRSKHFRLERLANGVYAAIASEQGYASCNAGIVDIGDETVVFDTFLTPEAARDLLRVTEQLTSNRIAYVVNSHEHNDHIRGNQVFAPSVDILSTAMTRDAIARNEPESIKSEKATIQKEITLLQSRLHAEKDARRRRELTLSICSMEGAKASYSELRTRLPNVTFEQKLTIHGTKKKVELLPLAGHTASDVILHIPEERIAFMSDLLFVGMHPYLASGSPEQWKKSLAKVRKLKVMTAVPGHGPTGKSKDIAKMLQYIESLERVVANMIKSGKSAEKASTEPVPSPFEDWLCLENFFVTNLKFLYRIAAQIKKDRKSGGQVAQAL